MSHRHGLGTRCARDAFENGHVMSESSLVADLSLSIRLCRMLREVGFASLLQSTARSCLTSRPRFLSAILEYVVSAWSLLCSLGHRCAKAPKPKRQHFLYTSQCVRVATVQILGPIFDPDNCVLYVCLNNGMKAVQFCCILHHFPRKSPQILAPAAGSYFFQYRQKVLGGHVELCSHPNPPGYR